VDAPSREHRLLIACARSVLSPGAPPGPALLDGVDAPRLAALALRHGMLPLLARYVGSSGAAGAALLGAIRLPVLEGARASMALAAELVALVRELEARGVRVMAYKGPALALQAYGDPALRRFGDLDLVVEPAELDAALAALEALGFVGDAFDTPSKRAAVLRDGHHLAVSRGTVIVELHWRFGKRIFGYAETLQGLWERRGTLSIAGAAVPVLGVGDHLLALSIHASKEAWSALEGILSVARLARALPEGEWEAVAARARAWGCARALQVSFLLSEELLSVPAPAALRAALPPGRGTRALARRLARQALAGSSSPAAYYRTQVALRPGLAAKLAFLARSLFVASPEDYAGGGSSRELALARLARPFRLLRKYGGGGRG
jgi:hypothetical protein